jgi:GT2 family glycosyltransferase
MPKVAILIVSYNAVRQGHADDLIASLQAIDYPAGDWSILIGDNGSDDGSPERFAAALPEATVVRFGVNLGFAEANTRLAEPAIERGCDYAYLLNQDCTTEPQFLRRVIEMIESDATIGSVQSRIHLHQDPTRLNTIGNAIHFLGFGFSLGSHRPVAEFPRDEWNGRDIAYASGAGMLVRLDLVRRIGLFEPAYYLYHEDLDFGWQLRLLGYRNVTAYDSVVYHKYTFSKDPKKYYFLERNRFLVLFENFRLATLLFLLPALVLFEIGIFAFAVRTGFVREKCAAYGYLLRWSNWRALLERRKRKQRRRVVSDRRMLRSMMGAITNPDIDSWLLRGVANPCLCAYFATLNCVVWW